MAAATGGTAQQSRRSVVLHFDLNRTVLMSDAAGGRTMENTVDYLLSECTWGYVHPHKPSEVDALSIRQYEPFTIFFSIRAHILMRCPLVCVCVYLVGVRV